MVFRFNHVSVLSRTFGRLEDKNRPYLTAFYK
ncbi:hypothetical protein [Caudoviricetes sp.]|nr:hypothetical protein [Caudoviricetes sp.]